MSVGTSPDCSLDVSLMEATALWKRLSLLSLCVHLMMIESNSIKAVLNPSEYRAVGAVVIDDCPKKMIDFSLATDNAS